MSQEFNLEAFLKNHKPKKINLELYLRCPKLKDYSILNKNNLNQLILYKTYIKMIRIEDLFRNKKLDDHIRAGGILLGGGIFDEKFIKTKNPNDWTHLMLKYEPKPDTYPDGRMIKKEPKIYVIKMSKYHLFFHNFMNGLRDDFQVILKGID